MAHSLSAKKRVRQNLKRRARNRARKRAIRKAIRAALEAAKAGDSSATDLALRNAVKVIDKVAAKGTLHRNTAARKKSRLVRRLLAMRS